MSCPDPVWLTQDGSGQLVTSVATDVAGNTAQASITVNIDTAPPTIALTSTVQAETIDASLTVEATVTDVLSSLASGTCSGTAASVTSGTLGCTVPLTLGRNVVLGTVVDQAGNTASISRRVTRISTDPIALLVTPVSASVLVNERRVVTAVDQFGRAVPNATWSTGDVAIADLTTDDDGTVFAVGVGAGTATITADLNGDVSFPDRLTLESRLLRAMTLVPKRDSPR